MGQGLSDFFETLHNTRSKRRRVERAIRTKIFDGLLIYVGEAQVGPAPAKQRSSFPPFRRRPLNCRSRRRLHRHRNMGMVRNQIANRLTGNVRYLAAGKCLYAVITTLSEIGWKRSFDRGLAAAHGPKAAAHCAGRHDGS